MSDPPKLSELTSSGMDDYKFPDQNHSLVVDMKDFSKENNNTNSKNDLQYNENHKKLLEMLKNYEQNQNISDFAKEIEAITNLYDDLNLLDQLKLKFCFKGTYFL